MTTSEPLAIEARALSKEYRVGFAFQRRVKALQGLELSVQKGQIYGLLGPNGAGKSTTIKILMNLVRASSGQALLFGQAPDKAGVRREVGFLPENPAPYEYLTGREFVRLAGHLCGLSGQELDRRVTEVVGSVDMGPAQNLQIRRYSKGMVQRLALAQAIVHKPKLLILDEPTSGLDPLGRRQMRDLILAERERGTTVLFCTHIIPDVEALCDRTALLVGGQRVREGSVRELVTSQTSAVELTVDGLSAEKVSGLGVPVSEVKPMEGRVLVYAAEGDSQRLLQAVLGAGGKVTSLQPVRSTLEDLFVKTVKDAGKNRVGGDIRV